MANEIKQAVFLDGRDQVLRMNLNNLSEIEEMTGQNVFTDAFWGNLSARWLRIVVYCCLPPDPQRTLQDVGEWINPSNFMKITAAVASLWQSSLPTADEVTATAERLLQERDGSSGEPPAVA